MKISHTPEPPRIWWCATGPLAFLPLHAAGLYHKKEPGFQAGHFVTSSYTPTLAALLDVAHTTKHQNFQLLVIAQPFTQGHHELPNTTQELDYIQNHAQQSNLAIQILKGDDATVESVLKHMQKSSWLHLACHGEQNIEHPLQSALLLQHGGRLELQQIVNMPLPNAEFVFMSACQTAMGDKGLSEEAVHLAAGMLLAGYRSVIATMWSIQDKYAPAVADDVYKHLFVDEQPDHTQAAHALHSAVRQLREQPDVSFASWVPFIHVGI